MINKPITPSPSQGAWKIWRTWLRVFWKVNEQGRSTVASPLPPPLHQSWKWFYNPVDGKLYEKIRDKSFQSYDPVFLLKRQSSRINKIFDCTAFDTILVADTKRYIPVTIFQKDTNYFQIEDHF